MDSLELSRFDMNKIKPTNVCAFVAKRNTGKCLEKGTEVLMYDGSVKKIEDIKEGEFVMGDDSTKRKVMGTTSGIDDLFEIENTNGVKYTVNSHHVLSLKNTNNNQCLDIPLRDYVFLTPHEKKTLLSYQVPVSFKSKVVNFDPYMIGYWIGNSTNLQDFIINKGIPSDYKINSKENRLKLLAGFIDANGVYDGCDIKIIYPKRDEILLDDIIFVAKSVGFWSYKQEKSCDQFIIHIDGQIDQIPTKKILVGEKLRKDSLLSPIKVLSKGKGEYYGFELDGNHRFVLGNFIVTHNSFLIRDLMFHQQSIPAGIVVSKTDKFTKYYEQFIPPVLINDEYSPDLLDKLFERQTKALAEKWPNPHAFLIFDDTISDANEWKRDKRIKEIFYNGRHYKILFLLTMQDPKAITPGLRSNIDYTFILKTPNQNIRRTLYENYCGMFPSFEIFEKVLDICTEDYGCLVVDNTSKSNKLEDQVFFYKASARDNFKLCSNAYWQKKKKVLPIGSSSNSSSSTLKNSKKFTVIKKN
jgi:hypothetical protein